MIFTGLGQGAGPWIAGALTEHWSSDYGEESIRYALAAMTTGLVVSGALYVVAAQRVPADLAALDRSRLGDA
jgi:hypothetical protein